MAPNSTPNDTEGSLTARQTSHDSHETAQEDHDTYFDYGEHDAESRPLQPQYSFSQDSQAFLPPMPAGTLSARDTERRLDDDLAMLQAERQVSNDQREKEAAGRNAGLGRATSLARSRSRRTDPVDEFDVNTNPVHEQNAVYRPPEDPSTRFARFFMRVHRSSFLVRYFTYIIPIVAILLVPLLLGALVFKDASVGGVQLMWFSVWLEIIWLTLWAGRIVAKAIPWPLGLFSSLFTNNSKKWRDMGKQLELALTLFFWWLGVEISFLPTMQGHLVAEPGDLSWMATVNRIIIAIFVGATLNLAEKIIIQLIAISFHLRTYQDRIETNKFQIGCLVKLYKYSKTAIAADDSAFEDKQGESGPGSGARTPMQYVEKAQRNFVSGFRRVGDVAGRVAGDFTGKDVSQSTHPHSVVLVLLNSTAGSQVLARRLYRTFVRPDTETVNAEDLKNAFDNDDEAEAAFTMFDRDMNGDISMEELEAVCVEIGRERKSITASLKDLDSVVSRLDSILVFVVVIITLLVFITLISTSAAGVLTSAGSTILALSWLFSATAQELLQSIIFVFVKHPFDVGDRVAVYGNTGATMKGDDYFVKEISLLYTEFKKMEGHVVQAPNSYLNNLFILNMRRSGGLAEAVPLTVKFGTTLDQIDELRSRLLEFVQLEKREYQPNILTEIREVFEAYSVNLNVVFFYKTNWQNEGLRLQRRNKFICALMVSMQEIGIEGPRARQPGAKEFQPFWVQHPAGAAPANGHSSLPPPKSPQYPISGAGVPEAVPSPASAQASMPDHPLKHYPSALRSPASTQFRSRARGPSVSSMAKRVDFSLGMKDMASGDPMGDVFDNQRDARLAEIARSSAARSRERSRLSEDDGRRSFSSTRAAFASGRDDGATGSLLGQQHHRQPSNSSFGLHRASTESQTGSARNHFASLHRPRFGTGTRLGRDSSPNRAFANERLMEAGMAAIPESALGSSTAPSSRGHDSTTPLAMPTPSRQPQINIEPPPSAVVPAPSESSTGRIPPLDAFEMRQMDH